MLKLFLWLRYLRKKKIVYLSIAAIALSVSLLIVVASLFTSFIGAFERSAVEAMGDVVLTAPTKFAKYPLFIERLEQTHAVEAATAVLSAQGLLHLGKGNVRAVNIWGIEPGRRAKVTDYKRFLLKQKDSPGEPTFEIADSRQGEGPAVVPIGIPPAEGLPERIGGFVGIAVAAEPDEKTDEYDDSAVKAMFGQQAVLTTGAPAPAFRKEDAGGQEQVKRRAVKFTIVDVFQTGVYELDKRFVYLPIEQLQKILYPDEQAQLADQIQIKLADDIQIDDALAQIRGVWQVFAEEQLEGAPHFIKYTDIETAKQMQSRYIAELWKQMGVLLLIFGVVDCSVIVLIFCIFYMIVMTRRRDIAIVKSCGAASSSVTFVFVGFGICVGMIGSVLGAFLGYVITKNINTIEGWIRIIFGLKLWKSSVYMFSRIPNDVNWPSALQIILLAVAAAAIGALIPAVIAARTRPVDILRYE